MSQYACVSKLGHPPNSRARKGGGEEVEGGEGGISKNLRRRGREADDGGMVQPSQQHVAPCV